MAASLALLVDTAHAQPACRIGQGVDLTIELEPPDVTTRKQLQQRLAVELRARELEVCPLGPGERSLAHVYVSAPLPELSPTRVRIHTDAGAALERTLDIAALPLEARPSAIASATDELLSAVLESAPASPAKSEVTAPNDRATGEAAASPARNAAWRLPYLELGLGGGGTLFMERGKAYGAELLARWRPLPRLSATVRVGGDRGRSTAAWLYGELYNGWHAGLDAGVELLEPAEGLGLAAHAGLALARVRRTEELEVATPVGTGLQRRPVGSSWEVAANAGGEVSFRTGPWGAALGLSGLVPFTPREQNLDDLPGLFVVQTPSVGFGEELGGEVTVRLWVALGS